MKERLTKHRRTLHQIPELGDELYKTKEYILSVLKELDCEITELLNSGLLVYFDKGKETTVGFRADMDALPVTEINDVPYKSTHEGKMHACGHDGHMALALGLAEYVASHDTKHNILIIFQPAEEILGGGMQMCETGEISKYNPVAILAYHMWPFAEAGETVTKSGAIMSQLTIMDVDFTGVSAHVTQPEKGVNALHAASMFIDDAYRKHEEICAKARVPEDKTILGMCVMECGTAFNIIPKKATVKGCVRSFSEANDELLVETVRTSAESMAAKIGAGADIRIIRRCPAVLNDVALYEKAKAVGATELDGPQLVSEDFAYFADIAPTLLMLLGTGTGIPLHGDTFDFDEEVLVKGVEFAVKLIESI